MKGFQSTVLAMLVALPVVGSAAAAETNVTWKSSVSLGATAKSGNTDKTLYTMNLKGGRYAPKSDLISSLYGEYGETEDEQTEGLLRGQSNYRYKFGSQNWNGGAFVEVYHNDLKKIRYRVKSGPSFGYYFLNTEALKLDVSGGINYVRERTSEGETAFAEYRVAGNVLWSISATASYYLNLEYTANVEDVSDGSGLLVTGLKSKVNEDLSIFVELRDDYDNKPPAGVSDNDRTLTAGLAYDF